MLGSPGRSSVAETHDQDASEPRRALDVLLFATLFTISFTKLGWQVGSVDLDLSEVAAGLFVAVFALTRLAARDWLLPRTAGILTAFFGGFAAVYLAGFFNLATADDLTLFKDGVAKFGIHFAFLVAAVAYLARRSEQFYWRAVAWFVAGLAANGLYGLVQLAAIENGTLIDRILLGPIGSYQSSGINAFGDVDGESVFRPNALTLTPNHIAIMLAAGLYLALPLYLRLRRGHPLSILLAATVVLLLVAEAATFSRSGALAIAVGLAVLAVPYRSLLLTRRVLVPVAAVIGVIALVVAARPDFFESVLAARATTNAQSRLAIWQQLPQALEAHPFFGLGLNTFSSYYEFATGETGKGPHSYYVAVLSETGLAGTALALAFLAYVVRQLRILHLAGYGAGAVDTRPARARLLAWGLTAAFVGTLAANLFLVTISLFYFFGFVLLVCAAPAIFAEHDR